MTIDLKLQIADELNKEKDVKVMKIIHDLKNPVTAIMQVLNDKSDTSIENMRKQTNIELEDLIDMLDNLR